jgi:hypothetical protein
MEGERNNFKKEIIPKGCLSEEDEGEDGTGRCVDEL